MYAAFVAAHLLFAAAAEPGPPPAFSDCVWAGLPAEARESTVAAIRKDLRNSAALARHDAAVRVAARGCAGGRDVTPLLMQAAAASAAIRAATAETLLQTENLSADQLRERWRTAPEPAKACVRGNAGRAFGQKGGCSAPERAVDLVESLGIDPRKEKPAFAAAAAWFNATAQSEWADAFVAYELRRSKDAQ